jgi:hypothetical protein
MNLTILEKKILESIVDNSVSDKVEYLLDDNYTWVNIDEIYESTGISKKRIRGVLSSLVKKGILDDGDEKMLFISYGFLEELKEKNIKSLYEITKYEIPKNIKFKNSQIEIELSLIEDKEDLYVTLSVLENGIEYSDLELSLENLYDLRKFIYNSIEHIKKEISKKSMKFS